MHHDQVILAEILEEIQRRVVDAHAQRQPALVEQMPLWRMAILLFAQIEILPMIVAAGDADRMLNLAQRAHEAHRILVEDVPEIAPELRPRYPGFYDVYERYVQTYLGHEEEIAAREIVI